MNILLVGRESAITKTIHQMLASTEGWQVTVKPSWEDLEHQINIEKKGKSLFDIFIANLTS